MSLDCSPVIPNFRAEVSRKIAIITGLFSAFVSNYVPASFAGASTADLWLGFEAFGLMGAYSLYALAAVISVYFVIRHVHETRGLELEEMPGGSAPTPPLDTVMVLDAGDWQWRDCGQNFSFSMIYYENQRLALSLRHLSLGETPGMRRRLTSDWEENTCA